jgi:hypothetical protein
MNVVFRNAPTGALAEVAYGLRLTHSTYKMIMEITAGETISGQTASRDLRALVDAKLLKPVGQTRGRHYVAEPILLAERQRIQADRAPRETGDPFELATRPNGRDYASAAGQTMR